MHRYITSHFRRIRQENLGHPRRAQEEKQANTPALHTILKIGGSEELGLLVPSSSFTEALDHPVNSLGNIEFALAGPAIFALDTS